MNYENIALDGIDAAGNKKSYTLNDFKGEKVILYFYPKDETSYCTKEACDFRDRLSHAKNNEPEKKQEKIPAPTANKNQPRVIGVSQDSIDSHKNFHKKEGLNFILLSDPKHVLAKAMEVPVMIGGMLARTTFLIDETGKIVKKWDNVDVDGHVDEVMKKLQ